jgi:hypothetical protein
MRFRPVARPSISVTAIVCLGALGCVRAVALPTSDLVVRRNDIGQAEIQSVLQNLATAHDIVRSLRPEMLVARDAAPIQRGVSAERGARAVEVYVDDFPHGGLETLAAIPARAVARIQRITPVEAASRFGGTHPGGIVIVTTVTNRVRR